VGRPVCAHPPGHDARRRGARRQLRRGQGEHARVRGSKANHLAYVGDTSIGERVNFGAGSITANYDGANKHRTTIGDDASIGSNVVLVAPIDVGAGATVAGGSTLSKDAPAGELTVARAPQTTVKGWRRPSKKPRS
jgi:bifunctional UDP-N-acetylglucosamine pyrophosphorylase/glucosamine-1-phosphate N-acetyltransferase